MKGYNIQVVSNITGVSIHTLRAWEKRYATVNPERTDTGRRVYSEGDVKKLKTLKQLSTMGHSIGTIAKLSQDELDNLSEKYKETAIQMGSNDFKFDNNPQLAKDSLKKLLFALSQNRLDIISHEIYNLKVRLSPKELALDIISPLMGRVGQYVDEDRLTIGQEHALSSIIKFHLGSFIYQAYEANNFSKNLAIIATPENDHHEFGILLASLLFTQYQKNFFYLGPHMPVNALIQAAQSIEANEIIIGTSVSSPQSDGINLTNYLEIIMNSVSPETKVIIGGPGFFDIVKFKNFHNLTHFPTLDHLNKHLRDLSLDDL